MKKIITVFILVVALVLCGCGETKETPAEAAVKESDAGAAPLMTAEEQKTLLMGLYEQWAFEELGYPYSWYYSFTDLDRNGRMEVITGTTQGSGVFTTAHVRELSEGFNSLVPCSDFSAEGSSYPEICVKEAVCFYDSGAGRYWYIFEDLTKNGYAEQYYSVWALSLSEGHIDSRVLASKEVIYSDVDKPPAISCRDEGGNAISEAEYGSAAERAFAGCEKSVLPLEWVIVDVDRQQPTEAANSAAAAPAPVITKNPSSEALSAGGKTWFIAHADNADSITWLFTSPAGQLCSIDEAMAANPGLWLEVLPEDTIAVSNVPVSFSGWAIQARFDGPGGSAVTQPAYIGVSDYEAAYEPVIEKYRAAYASGNTSAQYAVENGLSYLMRYTETMGYALKDLDKNGIPELIIAAIHGEYVERNMVIELYTLSGGNIVKLCESMERARHYLLSDNRLYFEGSGGAAYQTYEFYALNGTSLSFVEGFQSSNSSDLSGSVFYHTTVPVTEFSGIWGDYDRFDATGSREQVEAIMNSVRQTIWMPRLTPIK